MVVLGLDISTSCTGWCILEYSGSSVAELELGYIPLQKLSTSYSKAQQVASVFEDIKERHAVAKIAIEENLQSFRTGMSSAKTLASLARFNGVVSYLSEQIFKKTPEFINVNSARKLVGISLVRRMAGGAPTKEQVMDWVSAAVNEIDDQYRWPTKTLKSGPRKGQTIMEPGCYDMADAFVIAAASHNIEQ